MLPAPLLYEQQPSPAAHVEAVQYPSLHAAARPAANKRPSTKGRSHNDNIRFCVFERRLRSGTVLSHDLIRKFYVHLPLRYQLLKQLRSRYVSSTATAVSDARTVNGADDWNARPSAGSRLSEASKITSTSCHDDREGKGGGHSVGVMRHRPAVGETQRPPTAHLADEQKPKGAELGKTRGVIAQVESVGAQEAQIHRQPQRHVAPSVALLRARQGCNRNGVWARRRATKLHERPCARANPTGAVTGQSDIT